MAHLFLSYISKEKLQSEEESDNLPGKVEGLNLYLNTIKYIFHYRTVCSILNCVMIMKGCYVYNCASEVLCAGCCSPP